MIPVPTEMRKGVRYTGDEWVVSGYQEGCKLLKARGCTARPPLASLALKLSPPGLDDERALFSAVFQQVTFAKASDHVRLRKALVGPLRTLRGQIEPIIRHTVQALLDTAGQQDDIDLETDFAAPLALQSLTHLLGWPDELVQVQQMAAWSNALADLTTSHGMSQALPVVQEMAAAFRALVAAKHSAPGADLTSQMAANTTLSETECIVNLMVVFGAGTSTTITAICNGLPLLLAESERLALLRAELADGQANLTDVADEVVGRVTPTTYTRRWTTQEVELGGERLQPGCPVLVHLGEMNHDPRWFPDPDILDWHRAPRPAHVAFGAGPHTCPGADIALLELRLALEGLLSFPGLRLVAPPEGWSHNPNQRRAQRVRVALHEGGHP